MFTRFVEKQLFVDGDNGSGGIRAYHETRQSEIRLICRSRIREEGFVYEDLIDVRCAC